MTEDIYFILVSVLSSLAISGAMKSARDSWCYEIYERVCRGRYCDFKTAPLFVHGSY